MNKIEELRGRIKRYEEQIAAKEGRIEIKGEDIMLAKARVETMKTELKKLEATEARHEHQHQGQG